MDRKISLIDRLRPHKKDKTIAFIDCEVSTDDGRMLDIGAFKSDSAYFHKASISEFHSFVAETDYLCGHNIIDFDIKKLFGESDARGYKLIDTLYLSPLLFPEKPYHKLIKDDKIVDSEFNNPLSHSKKAAELFKEEQAQFWQLRDDIKKVYYCLLNQSIYFKDFFSYIDYCPRENENIDEIIKTAFSGKICENADVLTIASQYPIELAYALALISTSNIESVTPPWLVRNFHQIANIIHLLRNVPCKRGCRYCNDKLDIHKGLKKFFDYDEFRKFGDKKEPLQEEAVQAAVDGKSIIAVFPTGGGKSLTFQLPALMSGEALHGLTVVITPLVSLMKDQVENLEARMISTAVTINGMLDPMARKNALERVMDGSANLLYISPEMLRSRTIDKVLRSRNIVRFVIDEAHCFSAWGQDFRVDYLYIGEYIRKLCESKQLNKQIPVSCFTATAKRKVITDITDYFEQKLGIKLEIYATTATRENLHYKVIHVENDQDKYKRLRAELDARNCPSIVYVAYAKEARRLAERLQKDGISALPYYGKLNSNNKDEYQNSFKNNDVQVIVATTAFGMGVDKDDIGLVVHYDISDSLENYMQEAGRAGRSANLQADCVVLYNEEDLNKHFTLLNNSKLSLAEINQIWKAVKVKSKKRDVFYSSPLELAIEAGWPHEDVQGVETKVKSALNALESAGYIRRGQNSPRVYATGVLVRNAKEASERIQASSFIPEEDKRHACDILRSLISTGYRAKAGNNDNEKRVDYIADIWGLERRKVIEIVNSLRQSGLLGDGNDMYVYDETDKSKKHALSRLNVVSILGSFIFDYLEETGLCFNRKKMNTEAVENGVKSSPKEISTILNFLAKKNYIEIISKGKDNYQIDLLQDSKYIRSRFASINDICKYVIEEVFSYPYEETGLDEKERRIPFSLIEIHKHYEGSMLNEDATLQDFEEAVLFLSEIKALAIEGNFMVLYNSLEITRLNKSPKARYKESDYKLLNEFYQQKIRQIHIIGEFANLLVKDLAAAMEFVSDYFNQDFKDFIKKYFKGDDRQAELGRGLTPGKYKKVFDGLSKKQLDVISDKTSQYIVVAAGPGSGKTKLLVHKLASLLLLEENVKPEQLLMLTFSRSAAGEFKSRLLDLIGPTANYVDIKTFHSYCFDILGLMGTLTKSDEIIRTANEKIMNGEIEPEKITKSVLVIDEAQDMSEEEFTLVKLLMEHNDGLRVIAVGDDDQNIYEFNHFSPKYMASLVTEYHAAKYEMTENYRSGKEIVAFSNKFAKCISKRMKTEEMTSKSSNPDKVEVLRFISEHLSVPLVRHLKETQTQGTSCVLTRTNEEALQVQHLLIKNGINAKLVQSLGDFKLHDLSEVRFFIKCLDRNGQNVVISPKDWQYALNELEKKFSKSMAYENVRKMLLEFANQNGETAYRTDFDVFIDESSFEDFYENQNGSVFVSTLHKAKGREYDTVHILLDDYSAQDDEEKRLLYVGMTRAKTNLYIYTNNNVLDRYASSVPGVHYINDNREYPESTEITLQLGYRDVHLGMFKYNGRIISSMRAGATLTVEGNNLIYTQNDENTLVIPFSKKMAERIEMYRNQGYRIVSANVRFIVWWYDSDADYGNGKDVEILLVNLDLDKQ